MVRVLCRDHAFGTQVSGRKEHLVSEPGAMMIKGDPYDYPLDGDLRPANTALIIIDMQFDFCGEGGYVDKMGYDISLTRAAIEPIRIALVAARSWRCHILHTREPGRVHDDALQQTVHRCCTLRRLARSTRTKSAERNQPFCPRYRIPERVRGRAHRGAWQA